MLAPAAFEVLAGLGRLTLSFESPGPIASRHIRIVAEDRDRSSDKERIPTDNVR
jgi:hypothetical protein